MLKFKFVFENKTPNRPTSSHFLPRMHSITPSTTTMSFQFVASFAHPSSFAVTQEASELASVINVFIMYQLYEEQHCMTPVILLSPSYTLTGNTQIYFYYLYAYVCTTDGVFLGKELQVNCVYRKQQKKENSRMPPS